MRITSIAALSAFVVATTASVSCGSDAPPDVEAGATMVAGATLTVNGGGKLTVSTGAWMAGGDIPLENTQYRGNVFPGLRWSSGPAETKSYAIIMQDGDGLQNGVPYLHWVMVNVPAGVTALEKAMTTPPPGALYGPNYMGANQAYLGPRTPRGPKHRYHLQVFALDAVLAPEALASYAALTAAMNGHVLASGETVGLGSAPSRGSAVWHRISTLLHIG